MDVSLNKSTYDERAEDQYAYKIAMLYFIANGISAAMSTTLSPLSKTLSLGYDVSEGSILYLNSVFNFYFIFFNFPANYCIEKYGIKTSLNFGIALTLIGAWLRVGIDIKVSTVMLGQTMMAIAGPFITNIITRISNKWFSPKNRAKMTSLMSSSYMFGLGTGFLLSSLILTDNGELEIRKKEIYHLMINSAVVCTAIMIPVWCYFREEPAVPPSMSALSTREEFGQSLVSLLQNKDYLYLLIIFSVGLNNFISMVSMIHHVIAPFKYSEYEISNIGIIINFSSGFSKIAIAYIAGKSISFKRVIAGVFSILSVCTLLFMYTLSGGHIGKVYIMAALFGFFCQMYWGPTLEYANEVTFPVSEAQATGGLLFGGCMLSVVSNFIVSKLYTRHSDPENFLIYMFISYIFCVGMTHFVTDKLKREEYETFNILGNMSTFQPVPLSNFLNNSALKNKGSKKFYV